MEGVFLLWEWSWQLEIGHGNVVVGVTFNWDRYTVSQK